ncbi:hypothetical protein B0H12DRAFT_807603 [Mycena haematopus]|nr:hypothetical protein B0H12DRAFT_807603 [Mycena haematopus]
MNSGGALIIPSGSIQTSFNRAEVPLYGPSRLAVLRLHSCTDSKRSESLPVPIVRNTPNSAGLSVLDCSVSFTHFHSRLNPPPLPRSRARSHREYLPAWSIWLLLIVGASFRYSRRLGNDAPRVVDLLHHLRKFPKIGHGNIDRKRARTNRRWSSVTTWKDF